ncbi:hypothetical protein F5141DRAFT_1097127 [Pisolithus sp. B1]|nr:hypothetical protein F5141DRAFT_1097127 [Pisolithus sp. B1]
MTKSMPGQKFMTRAYSDMVKSLDKLFSGTGTQQAEVCYCSGRGSAIEYDSARIPADGRLIYPPYCQLGWDARADPFEGTAGHQAISKLSGTSENKNLSLVVLSQRVCLNITFGHHEAVEFVESAVASHLLVCIAITDDRNWSFTTYPSEPFLSCAAASLLHEEGNLDIFLKALEVKVLSRMIDVGKSGELASRLLWLLAKDLYVRRTPLRTLIIPAVDGQEWNSELADCQMTSVLEYFCFVFGDDFWDRAGKKA